MRGLDEGSSSFSSLISLGKANFIETTVWLDLPFLVNLLREQAREKPLAPRSAKREPPPLGMTLATRRWARLVVLG